MSTLTLPLFATAHYTSSARRLVEPFPSVLKDVFDRVKELSTESETKPRPVSAQTAGWATSVLLQAVPTFYLESADIRSFESEIHVVWENEKTGKKVILLFPAERQLKIYYERFEADAVAEHRLLGTADLNDVADRLDWFFSD